MFECTFNIIVLYMQVVECLFFLYPKLPYLRQITLKCLLCYPLRVSNAIAIEFFLFLQPLQPFTKAPIRLNVLRLEVGPHSVVFMSFFFGLSDFLLKPLWTPFLSLRSNSEDLLGLAGTTEPFFSLDSFCRVRCQGDLSAVTVICLLACFTANEFTSSPALVAFSFWDLFHFVLLFLIL